MKKVSPKPQLQDESSHNWPQINEEAHLEFFDIGVNLGDPQMFKDDEERSMIIKRAKHHNVSNMILTTSDFRGLETNISLCESNKLYTTIGCHPCSCMEIENNSIFQNSDSYFNALRAKYEENKKFIVAVGECGLDYHPEREKFCGREIQKKYFEMQLELAKELELPMFLHCRGDEAYGDLIAIFSKVFPNYILHAPQAVVHSFSSSRSHLKQLLDFGFSIGINGLSFKTQETIDAIKEIPLERLLADSDSPYCQIRKSFEGFKHIKTVYPKSKSRTDPVKLYKGYNEPSNIM
ncbi:MAG: TatD DNase [Marteilia pararefringens]